MREGLFAKERRESRLLPKNWTAPVLNWMEAGQRIPFESASIRDFSRVLSANTLRSAEGDPGGYHTKRAVDVEHRLLATH